MQTSEVLQTPHLNRGQCVYHRVLGVTQQHQSNRVLQQPLDPTSLWQLTEFHINRLVLNPQGNHSRETWSRIPQLLELEK